VPRDFEIVKIKENTYNFEVTIEYKDNKERERFGYPYNNGWEQEVDGEPRFVKDLRENKVPKREAGRNTTLTDEMKEKVRGAKVEYPEDQGNA